MSEIMIKNFTFSGLEYKIDTLFKNNCGSNILYFEGNPIGTVYKKNCYRFINDSIALKYNGDSITFGKKLFSSNILNSNYQLKVYLLYQKPLYYYSFHFVEPQSNICNYESYSQNKILEGYMSTSMTIQLDLLSPLSDDNLDHLIRVFSNPTNVEIAEPCCCEPTQDEDDQRFYEDNKPDNIQTDSILYID